MMVMGKSSWQISTGLLRRAVHTAAAAAPGLRHVGGPVTTVLTSVHSFPSFEPRYFQTMDAQLLYLPLRRDLLWKAAVFEGDKARIGSGNTISRSTAGYSRHKLRPQKGTGRARLGDRNSPMLGTSKAHGPRAPNKHATRLHSRMYALAMRTALSHLYQNGRLTVVGEALEFNDGKNLRARTLADLIARMGWQQQHLLFLSKSERNELKQALSVVKPSSRALTIDNVEVRDILKAGHLIIERKALKYIEFETARSIYK